MEVGAKVLFILLRFDCKSSPESELGLGLTAIYISVHSRSPSRTSVRGVL